MAAGVEQDDFLFGDQDGERYSILMGNADCLHPFQLAAQVVIPQMRLKRVTFEIPQDGSKRMPQFTMALVEFFRRAGKPGCPDKGIHDSLFQFQLFDQVVRGTPLHPACLQVLE